jgi:hypothetical protein
MPRRDTGACWGGATLRFFGFGRARMIEFLPCGATSRGSQPLSGVLVVCWAWRTDLTCNNCCAQWQGTDTYLNMDRITAAKPVPGCMIFRYRALLLQPIGRPNVTPVSATGRLPGPNVTRLPPPLAVSLSLT